jgi:hypothetical protein
MVSKRAGFFEGIPNALGKRAIYQRRSPLFRLCLGQVNAHGIRYPQSVLKKALDVFLKFFSFQERVGAC